MFRGKLFSLIKLKAWQLVRSYIAITHVTWSSLKLQISPAKIICRPICMFACDHFSSTENCSPDWKSAIIHDDHVWQWHDCQINSWRISTNNKNIGAMFLKVFFTPRDVRVLTQLRVELVFTYVYMMSLYISDNNAQCSHRGSNSMIIKH